MRLGHPLEGSRLACVLGLPFFIFMLLVSFFSCLASRWVGCFLRALSVATGAGVRLVRAQPGERTSPAPAENCASRGGHGDCCARGVSLSPRLNLSPGSRQWRRRRAPGPGRPRSPQSSHNVCRQLFCSRKFAFATPGMRARSGRLRGCWTGRGSHVAVERALYSGRGKPPGWPRWGLAERGAGVGAPAWLLHMARRVVRHGHTGGVTFLPILDLQARGIRLPRSGFLLVVRGRRRGRTSRVRGRP